MELKKFFVLVLLLGSVCPAFCGGDTMALVWTPFFRASAPCRNVPYCAVYACVPALPLKGIPC